MFWRSKKQDSLPSVATSEFSLGGEAHSGANSDAVMPAKIESAQPPQVREVARRGRPGAYVIPAGYKISGPIFTTRPVHIDGELAGRGLVAREVFVSASGVLRQSAEVDYLVVEGRVLAPIKARKSIELRAGGEIRGDVESPVLQVAPGGILSDCSLAVGGER
jgi:cytoskeletal protein CcmA (bactofilin family)